MVVVVVAAVVVAAVTLSCEASRCLLLMLWPLCYCDNVNLSLRAIATDHITRSRYCYYNVPVTAAVESRQPNAAQHQLGSESEEDAVLAMIVLVTANLDSFCM